MRLTRRCPNDAFAGLVGLELPLPMAHSERIAVAMTWSTANSLSIAVVRFYSDLVVELPSPEAVVRLCSAKRFQLRAENWRWWAGPGPAAQSVECRWMNGLLAETGENGSQKVKMVASSAFGESGYPIMSALHGSSLWF